MARNRTYTRMEKAISSGSRTGTAGSEQVVGSFQLENGDEECQIKRLVLSATKLPTSAPGPCQLRFGLFQEQPTQVTDFIESATIYSYVFDTGTPQILNETTTVRVPRGWYLGYIFNNLIAVQPSETLQIGFNFQLNYKVLSWDEGHGFNLDYRWGAVRTCHHFTESITVSTFIVETYGGNSHRYSLSGNLRFRNNTIPASETVTMIMYQLLIQ